MMENLSDNNPAQGNRSAGIPASLGTILREAREGLGLSVADVAAQIKFAPRQIEALEADDFKSLPEAAFLRGFVRSYAKILHLEAQPLLAALPQVKAAMAESIPASVEVPYPGENISQKQTLILLGTALLLAVIAVGFAVWHFTSPLRKPAAAQIESPVVLPAEKQVIHEPTAEKRHEPPEEKHALAAESGSAEPKRKAPTTAAQSAVRAAKTNIVHVTPQTQTTDSGDAGDAAEQVATLRLVFDEESWTEITDKDGKIISSQVNPRGSELNVKGQLPLSLVIGHADTTHLYQDGEPVDLTPYINSSSVVARITLE